MDSRMEEGFFHEEKGVPWERYYVAALFRSCPSVGPSPRTDGRSAGRSAGGGSSAETSWEKETEERRDRERKYDIRGRFRRPFPVAVRFFPSFPTSSPPSSALFPVP